MDKLFSVPLTQPMRDCIHVVFIAKIYHLFSIVSWCHGHVHKRLSFPPQLTTHPFFSPSLPSVSSRRLLINSPTIKIIILHQSFGRIINKKRLLLRKKKSERERVTAFVNRLKVKKGLKAFFIQPVYNIKHYLNLDKRRGLRNRNIKRRGKNCSYIKVYEFNLLWFNIKGQKDKFKFID